MLRSQVNVELKKRRLVFFTFFALCFIYLSVGLVFGEMGLIRYLELRKIKTHMQAELDEIQGRNDNVRMQLKLLKEDPFYREKVAREEFGLARPDEYIFQYER